MGDDKGGTAIHQTVHTLLHQRFGAGVNGRSGFVQNQHRGIGNSGTGNRQQLPLALGKICSVPGQHRLIALRQTADKAVGVGKLCRGNAFLVGCVQPTIADILHDRSGKQVGILKHDAKGAAQICFFNLVDIDPVIADLAIRDVIESVDQVGNGSLARAGRADKGDFLPRRGIQLDVVQDGFARLIAKVHIIKGNVTLQLS